MKLTNHLTILGAARQLGYHPSTVYELVRSGKLTAVKVGRMWQIPNNSIESYVRDITSKPTGESRV